MKGNISVSLFVSLNWVGPGQYDGNDILLISLKYNIQFVYILRNVTTISKRHICEYHRCVSFDLLGIICMSVSF